MNVQLIFCFMLELYQFLVISSILGNLLEQLICNYSLFLTCKPVGMACFFQFVIEFIRMKRTGNYIVKIYFTM